MRRLFIDYAMSLVDLVLCLLMNKRMVMLQLSEWLYFERWSDRAFTKYEYTLDDPENAFSFFKELIII